MKVLWTPSECAVTDQAVGTLSSRCCKRTVQVRLNRVCYNIKHTCCQESPIIFPYLFMIPNMWYSSHTDPTIDSMRPARDSFFTFDLLLSSLAGKSCTLYLVWYHLLSSLAVHRRLRRSTLVWGLGHQAEPCHRCTTLCCDRDTQGSSRARSSWDTIGYKNTILQSIGSKTPSSSIDVLPSVDTFKQC